MVMKPPKNNAKLSLTHQIVQTDESLRLSCYKNFSQWICMKKETIKTSMKILQVWPIVSKLALSLKLSSRLFSSL